MADNKDHWDLTEKADAERIGGGPGAADAYSGAGNATGTPDAETGMRAGDAVNRGDVEEDRKRLFPDQGGADSDAQAHANEGSLKNHGDKLEGHLPGQDDLGRELD